MSFEYPCEDMIFKINEYKRELTLEYAKDVFGRLSMTIDEVNGLFVVYRTELETFGICGVRYLIREIKSLVTNKHYVFDNPAGLPYSCIIEMKVEQLKFKFTKESFNPKVKYSATVVMKNGDSIVGGFSESIECCDDVFIVLESSGGNLMAFQNTRTKVKFYLLNQNYVDMQTLIMNPSKPEKTPIKFKFTEKSLALFGKKNLVVNVDSGAIELSNENLRDIQFEIVESFGPHLSKFKVVGGNKVYTICGYPNVCINHLEFIQDEVPSMGEMVFPTETLEDPTKNYMIVVNSDGYSLQDKERNILAQASSQSGIKEISPMAKSIFEVLENVI